MYCVSTIFSFEKVLKTKMFYYKGRQHLTPKESLVPGFQVVEGLKSKMLEEFRLETIFSKVMAEHFF